MRSLGPFLRTARNCWQVTPAGILRLFVLVKMMSPADRTQSIPRKVAFKATADAVQFCAFQETRKHSARRGRPHEAIDASCTCILRCGSRLGQRRPGAGGRRKAVL